MAVQTMSDALAKRARERIEEQINTHGRNLASGNCQSFEDYKRVCGIIKGLQEALEIMDDAALDIAKSQRGG